MTNDILHHYNDEDHNVNSAREIIPYLEQYINYESIIDVGCGVGQWAFVFKERGVRNIWVGYRCPSCP